MEKARPGDQKGLGGGGEESTGTEHRNGAQGGTRTQGGTSRGSHCSHLGTGGSGGNAARVGRDKSVRVRCLLKESELHSVENAETLRRDTVRADSGRPRGDNVKHR